MTRAAALLLAFVALAATAAGRAGGVAPAWCARALPAAPAGLPAPLLVTTRCGRFALAAGRQAAYLGANVRPVSHAAFEYWPDTRIWFGFTGHLGAG